MYIYHRNGLPMMVEEPPAYRLKPAIFFDLDGTIRRSKSGKKFIDNAIDIELFPDVNDRVWDARNRHMTIVGISNQGGVAYGLRSMEDLDLETKTTCILFRDGNPFDLVIECPFHENGKRAPFNHFSMMRKPDTGMLALAEYELYRVQHVIIDWSRSLMVGDREEDQICAHGAHIPFMWAWEFFERERPADGPKANAE